MTSTPQTTQSSLDIKIERNSQHEHAIEALKMVKESEKGKKFYSVRVEKNLTKLIDLATIPSRTLKLYEIHRHREFSCLEIVNGRPGKVFIAKKRQEKVYICKDEKGNEFKKPLSTQVIIL